MAATSTVTTATTVDTSNNKTPMMEAIPSQSASSAMNFHTSTATIVKNTQQHDLITTHHYNGRNDNSCGTEVVKDDRNINTESNGSLSVPIHDNDNRTVSPMQQSITLQQTTPASEADRLADVKYMESCKSGATQPSLLFNTENTTGSSAESQNDFNTMDLLKEHLYQPNYKDDRLLSQLIQSTDEATTSDTNSIPNWDQLSLAHSAPGDSATTANGGYATLGFIHDQTTCATFANRPRVLSSLSRQSSIATAMENSSSNAFDNFNMNSTSWKPMFQKSHQEIQYSPAHIFSDRKIGTVPTSKAGTIADGTTSLALPPSIAPIVTSKADTPATDSTSAAAAGTVPSAVHTAGAETLLLAAKVLYEEGTSQNDDASKSKSSRRKSRATNAAALLNNEPGIASPQKVRSRVSKNQLVDFSAHGNVPEGHVIVDDGTGSRVVVLIPDADVTVHDVLLGRGGRTNHHEGNAKYRNYKESLQDEYLNATKDQKTSISNRLVTMMHQEHGRFLKAYEPAKDKNSDTKPKGNKSNASGPVEFWYEVDLLTARKKASQALREINTPENRAAKRAKYSK